MPQTPSIKSPQHEDYQPGKIMWRVAINVSGFVLKSHKMNIETAELCADTLTRQHALDCLVEKA
jgi:hypothetical protein